MRRSVFIGVFAIAWSALVIPVQASPDFPAKVKALNNPDIPEPPKCTDCHVGGMMSEAKGGHFKGLGEVLIGQRHAKVKAGTMKASDPVDIHWLKDYKPK